MAHTRNGMRVGAARHTELMEQREMIADAQRDYWPSKFRTALAELQDIDPDGWADWWNSDAVPVILTNKERYEYVSARIEHLKAERSKIDQRADQWAEARMCARRGVSL